MVDRASVRAWLSVGGIPPRELLQRTWSKLVDNEILLRASAAAYYALTAFVPFLAVIVALAAHLAPDITGESGARLIVAAGILISFSLTSYVGPNVRRRWKWVTQGSSLATLAFLASGLLLRVYVQYFGNHGKTYGSLAGVMLLSFWFWIAAVILLVALQIDRIIEDEQEEPP